MLRVTFKTHVQANSKVFGCIMVHEERSFAAYFNDCYKHNEIHIFFEVL